jgi:Cellulase (glycosyl hydrolase family 5)
VPRSLFTSLFLLSLLVSFTPVRAQSTTGTSYWHTDGNRIVDDAGRTIRIAGVNWFGMEDRYFVPAGLDKQPLKRIVTRIRSLGFNAIRLPFSNQLVEKNPVIKRHLQANPDLVGLHALDLLDRIVSAAQTAGLRVILDNARSSVGTKPERNGLWYTRAYPESAWIRDWQFLVTRYAGNPTVVGVDLRNEPHTAPQDHGRWEPISDTVPHGARTGGEATMRRIGDLPHNVPVMPSSPSIHTCWSLWRASSCIQIQRSRKGLTPTGGQAFCKEHGCIPYGWPFPTNSCTPLMSTVPPKRVCRSSIAP